jgi:hypothetical protein
MSAIPSMHSVPEELSASRRPGGVSSTVRREWLAGLLSLLGLYEIVLALSGRPVVAGLGVVSGILVVAAPWAGRRMLAAGLALLVAGTVPFAVVTWWSIITPVVALLALAIGVPVIVRRSRRPAPQRRQA